ncbi:hypothetical protein [Allobaculum sp. Allo2]|uniref:hypothetical protein n=1 Tax=Allobaculum sp. Allo2 TaxID=2853432 RepID=UPI001F5FFA65|nr:hypothetical protein [Allobaculum sp. Allo2]UNT92389.1 hypothetical protein KWG61_09385 [Allobaculum sp. Allo2]
MTVNQQISESEKRKIKGKGYKINRKEREEPFLWNMSSCSFSTTESGDRKLEIEKGKSSFPLESDDLLHEQEKGTKWTVRGFIQFSDLLR